MLRGVAAAIVVVMAVEGVRAQQPAPPLAEVARQAEAAKPTIRKAARTYTNASLAEVPKHEASPAAAAATAGAPATVAFESRSLGKAVPAEEMVARSEEKVERDNAAQQSEATWRMRANTLRMQIDEMRARIAELTVPNPLTEANPELQKSNANNIANARAALDGLRKQWGRLEVGAEEAKISREWLDPRPQFQ